jgi:hypothetical protein
VLDAMGQLLSIRLGKAHARFHDAAFGSHESLAHRCGTDHKRGGNLFRGEAHDCLEHERCADAHINRRVRAHEEQRQSLVRRVLFIKR